MASLIYSIIASLDGYIADEEGKFDWAQPDEEVHTFINELGRPIGTYLLGRRMYDVLAYWDDPPALDEQPSFVREFAEIWRTADKVVYSRTLEAARTAQDADRARLRPRGRPTAESTVGSRSRRRRSRSRLPGDQGRVGRRLPALRRAGRRRSRHAGPAARRPHRARTGGRTPVRQWHRVPSLPDVMTWSRGRAPGQTLMRAG